VNRIRHNVRIKELEWYAPDTFCLKVSFPKQHLLPGNFFQLRVDEHLDPFLNRPISVARYERGVLSLIVRVVGRGTALLSRKKQGDIITLFGPFGKGIQPAPDKSLLIAGGIGVAPLLFVARYLKRNNTPFTFLYGAREKRDLILTSEIRRMSDRCSIVAEKGFKKQRTVLEELAVHALHEYHCAYACGPRNMLITLQQMQLPMQVFAFCEDFLGCGCGLCLGCAIFYKGEYKRICEDGPIFELSGINFDAKVL
jgi:dihydroorotate dehydrogenase electron transfer subunit